MSKGLNTRGIDSLFGEGASNLLSGGETNKIRLSEIEPRSDQPRQTWDDETLAELSDSIRVHGVIQPLALRKLATGYYQIIAGERRWRAAKLAGLKEVPAVVFEADDRRATELALIENLQREDLNAIDEAEGYRMLIEDYGLTQEEVAERVSRSRSGVANALRLLQLSGGVRALLTDGKLSAGHARSLLPIEDEKLRDETAKKVAEEELSVRDTERLVKRLLGETGGDAPKKAKLTYVSDYEKTLSARYGRKVKIRAGDKKGKVEIEFYSPEDFENLMEVLGSGH